MPWKLYARACEALLSGHQDDARTLLQQAFDIDPEYAAALILRGLIELLLTRLNGRC